MNHMLPQDDSVESDLMRLIYMEETGGVWHFAPVTKAQHEYETRSHKRAAEIIDKNNGQFPSLLERTTKESR